MRSGALSSHTVAIALAAVFFAGSAGAGVVLCGEHTGHVSMQAHCDGANQKNKRGIDQLLDAETLKSHGAKFDRSIFYEWQRLDLSVGRNFGTEFVHDAKWVRPQFHDRAPARNIPEPGTLALLSIGLVGAALSRRCKRT